VAPTSLRDRFLTPRVARAMTSPLGILLAGAGAAAGIVALGPVGGVVGAAVAWGGRVLAAVPRAPAGPDIQPRTLGQPWRSYVERAQASQRRFDAAVRRARAGPLADRLAQIGDRVGTGVEESWEVAQRGHSLAEARRQIDVDAIVGDLKTTRRVLDNPASGEPGREFNRETYARTAEALGAQLASARRLEDVITRADAELRLLDARLAEAVTRAIELSAHAGDANDLGRLGDDVDGVVSEMEALRQALDEAGRPSGA
jgi:hypothetical protein